MSSVTPVPAGKLPTNQPDLWFEDNPVGRMKKEIWDMMLDQVRGLYPAGKPAARAASPSAHPL